MEMERTRPYRMGVRADAAAETGDRILDAATEVFWELPSDQISLDEVSRRAGVSVRTVIRRFGGKDGLLAAAGARALERTAEERRAPIGDLAGSVAVLVAHYEANGDRVLRMLAEEDRVAGLRPIVDRGRALHQQWCADVFAQALVGLRGTTRRRRLAQLVAVCDVYTWKLLRRDAGLSRGQTERALVELLIPLVEGS